MNYELDIEDAQILSESETSDFNSEEFDLWKWVAKTADQVTSKSQPYILTEALIQTGYAKDKTATRDAYRKHEEALNEYLNTVNTEKLIRKMVLPSGSSKTSKKMIGYGVPLAAGVLTGLILSKLIK
ncbi:MAG: hypothetical protein ACQETE_01600 [Bacteroidota bacterium]